MQQYCRYLELQSSGRKDEIRLHYTGYDAMVHIETFPYHLADNIWHKVMCAWFFTAGTNTVQCLFYDLK